MERAREQMGNGLPSFTGKFQTLLGFLAPAGFVLSAVWHPSSPNLRVVSRSLAGCRTGRAQSHTLHPTGSASSCQALQHVVHKLICSFLCIQTTTTTKPILNYHRSNPATGCGLALVCLTWCGWEGVTSSCRWGQSFPTGPGLAASQDGGSLNTARLCLNTHRAGKVLTTALCPVLTALLGPFPPGHSSSQWCVGAGMLGCT